MKRLLTLMLMLTFIFLMCSEIVHLSFSEHQLLWLRIDIYTYKTYSKDIMIHGNTTAQIGYCMNATYVTTINLNGDISLTNTSSQNRNIIILSTDETYIILHKGICTVSFTGTGIVNLSSKEYVHVKSFYVPIEENEAHFKIDAKDLPQAKIFLVVLGFEGVTNKVISSIVHNGVALDHRQSIYLLGTLVTFLANRTSVTGSYRIRLIQVPYMIPPVYHLEEDKHVWHYEGFMNKLYINIAKSMNLTIMSNIAALHLTAFIVPVNSSLSISAPHISLHSNTTRTIFLTRYEDLLIFSNRELVVRSNTIVYANISISTVYFSNGSGTIVIRYPENYDLKHIRAEALYVSPFAIIAKGVAVHPKPKNRLLQVNIVDYSEKPVNRIDAVISTYDLLSFNKTNLSIHSFPSNINITAEQVLYIVGYLNFTQVLNYTVMSPPPNVVLTASLCDVVLEIRDYEDRLVKSVNVYITGPKQIGPFTINTLCQNGSLSIHRMPIGHYTVIILMNGTELTRGMLNITRPGLYVIHVPLFSLRVKVFNTRGSPVEDAVIIIRNKELFFKGRTNTEGEVIIDKIMPNSYTIQVIWMNKTVYSDVVTITMGKDLFITLKLFRLEVKVNSPFLRLFKNISVSLSTNSSVISSPVNKYGIAEFKDLPPGTYTVKVLNIEKTVTIRSNDRLVIIDIPLSTTLRFLLSSYLIYVLLMLLALATIIILIRYRLKKALVLE